MLEIFDADFAADPWSVLTGLRDDGGVHRVRTPDGPPAWLVTRYQDVRAGLLDERLSTHIRYAGAVDYRGFVVPPPLDDNLLNTDPPDHLRLRRVVTGELSPRLLSGWAELAPALVDSCLREVDSETEIDLVTRLAVPLPAAVLGELLGLGEPERAGLLDWANSTLLPSATPPRARDTLTTMLTIIGATTERARARRPESLLGRLVAAHVDTGSPSAEELAGLLFYLLFVWYEVLVDLIAGSALTLLQQPCQRAIWCAAPDKRSAVDELLRYLSPQVLAGPRFARTDLTIGAETIRAGQTVLLCLAAAGHDPDVFDRPGELDLTRQRNPHLGLGYGAHACLGTMLVHTVAGAAVDHLFTQWPDLELSRDTRELGWRSGFRHRGPEAVRVVLN